MPRILNSVWPALLWAQKARPWAPISRWGPNGGTALFSPRPFRMRFARHSLALCSPLIHRFWMDFAVIPQKEKSHIEMSIRSPSPIRWVIPLSIPPSRPIAYVGLSILYIWVDSPFYSNSLHSTGAATISTSGTLV